MCAAPSIGPEPGSTFVYNPKALPRDQLKSKETSITISPPGGPAKTLMVLLISENQAGFAFLDKSIKDYITPYLNDAFKNRATDLQKAQQIIYDPHNHSIAVITADKNVIHLPPQVRKEVFPSAQPSQQAARLATPEERARSVFISPKLSASQKEAVIKNRTFFYKLDDEFKNLKQPTDAQINKLVKATDGYKAIIKHSEENNWKLYGKNSEEHLARYNSLKAQNLAGTISKSDQEDLVFYENDAQVYLEACEFLARLEKLTQKLLSEATPAKEVSLKELEVDDVSVVEPAPQKAVRASPSSPTVISPARERAQELERRFAEIEKELKILQEKGGKRGSISPAELTRFKQKLEKMIGEFTKIREEEYAKISKGTTEDIAEMMALYSKPSLNPEERKKLEPGLVFVAVSPLLIELRLMSRGLSQQEPAG